MIFLKKLYHIQLKPFVNYFFTLFIIYLTYAKKKKATRTLPFSTDLTHTPYKSLKFNNN
jgi:hypothetical protein